MMHSASLQAPVAVTESRAGRALLAAAAVLMGLLAQSYLLRRVFAGDAFALYVAAILLFIVAFPATDARCPSRIYLRLARISLVVVAAGIFAVAYSQLSVGRNFMASAALMLLPLPLLGMAAAGQRTTTRPDDEPDEAEAGTLRRVPATSAQTAVDVMILGLGAALAVVALVYWFRSTASNEAIVLNILSIVLLLIGVARLDRGQPMTVAPEWRKRLPPHELAIVILIVAFGAFMRLWQLDTLPFGIWYDEGETGLEALRIYNGMPYTPIGTYSRANPSFFFYVIALMYRFMGPTLLAVRLVQAITGLLAVPALYALLRYVFGWRTAVVGAMMIAASAWHVNFSRFGMPYSIGAPLFEILTVLFLLWGLRTGRLLAFALAGVAGGLGLHTYTGFRIFPIALVIYVVYALLLGKDRMRQSLVGLLVLGAMAALVFAPLGTWAVRNWPEFSSRMGQTSVFAGKTTDAEKRAALENSLRRHVLMLNYHGDGNGRHNLPGAPALDMITGAAFIIGLGYCLYRWRSPAYLLLAAWFFVTMMAGVMSLDWEAPQQARTIVAIPAICAIAAVPLGKVWDRLAEVARSLPALPARRLAALLVALLGAATLAVVGYVNYNQYFNRHMRNSEAFYSFSTIETVVARRVAELGPTANRYFIQNIGTPAYTFLVGGDSPQRPVDAVFFSAYAHMPLREPMSKTAVYLLEPWRVTIEPADVLRYYPHAEFVDHKDPFGRTMVYEFRVPADDVNNLLGLTGRYFSGDRVTGTPVIERVDKTVAFDWRSAPPLPGDFTVQWSGSLVPPEAGTYTLDLRYDGEVRVSLDGVWLDVGGGRSQVRVDLAKGLHPLIIELRGRSIELWWTRPNGQTQPVPATSLIALGLPEHGLVGSYYRGDGWQGRPEFVQVDPYLAFRWHPDPIEGSPWSVIWRGKIDIPQAGRYMFQGVTNDRMWLSIDGKTHLDGIRSMSEVLVDLTAGRHDIEVRYANAKGYSELRLMWRTPAGVFEVVPNRYLYIT